VLSGHWGQWVFDIESVNLTSHSITFGTGGWQEGRGTINGAEYYIDNVFAELDAPMEWFVDRTKRILYFMPNFSAPAASVFVASQRSCLISLRGDEASPVDNVLIEGLIFTHTSNTFFKKFDVPSGGDWSLHRYDPQTFTNEKSK
jgi:hypothetical protein